MVEPYVLVVRHRARTDDVPHWHRLGHAFQRLEAHFLQCKSPLHQSCRGSTERHGIECRQALEAGSDIGRIAHGELLLARPAAHLPNDRQPCVQSKADRHAYPITWLHMGIEWCHGLDNGQAGMHGAHGSVFVRLWPAKVEQQAIAEVLRHVAIKRLYGRYHSLLVGAHHAAVVFRVELLRQLCGIDEIAEQHRHLPAFGIGRMQRRRMGNS
jgi:hypothetical protein